MSVKRSFIVGDEWLYYKLYTGPKTADLVLTELIGPFANDILNKEIIDHWFFIRYADPHHHLRVRFHTSNSSSICYIILNIQKQLDNYLKRDLIWKVQLDTYNRELERYGISSIELSERLFFFESVMVIDFLDLIEGQKGEELRWLFGIRAIDTLLNAFQLNSLEKLNFIQNLKNNFSIEFNVERPLKKQLDSKYRQNSDKLFDFMNFTRESKYEYAIFLELLETRSKKTAQIAKEILDCSKKDNLEIKLFSLLSSYSHMLINRLFKSKNRLHELVCYDFLYRYYKSNLARKKYNG